MYYFGNFFFTFIVFLFVCVCKRCYFKIQLFLKKVKKKVKWTFYYIIGGFRP